MPARSHDLGVGRLVQPRRALLVCRSRIPSSGTRLPGPALGGGAGVPRESYPSSQQ
jgi:hypothetical protein